MKIYIAGQVTGLERDKVEKGFKRGETLLRSMNHEPVNPLDYIPPTYSQKDAMKFLVPLMLTCDGVLMLMNWELSEGAKIEFALAYYTGLAVMLEEDFE